MKTKKSAASVFTALFAALISVAFFFRIPLPGLVPIVLQDTLALLSGMLLGPVYGGAAVAVYLLLGIIGLPVFSGSSGLHVITHGYTGGFLVGYLLGAITAGLVLSLFLSPSKEYGKCRQWIVIISASLAATVVLFACGIIEFMRVAHCGIGKAFAACLIPFIPGNLIKQTINVILTKNLRPVIKNYLYEA